MRITLLLIFVAISSFAKIQALSAVVADTTATPGWFYWSSYTKISKDVPKPQVAKVSGLATHKCIRYYSFLDKTKVLNSYKLTCSMSAKILIYARFYDGDCKNFEENFYYGFADMLQIFAGDRQHAPFDNYATCSEDSVLPIPKDATFATNYSFNNLNECYGQDDKPARFTSYRENQCLHVYDPLTDTESVIYKLPWVYRYHNANCTDLWRAEMMYTDQCRTTYTSNYFRDIKNDKMFVPKVGGPEDNFYTDEYTAPDDTYATEYAYGSEWAHRTPPPGDDQFPAGQFDFIWDDSLASYAAPEQVFSKWQKTYEFQPSRRPTLVPGMTALPTIATTTSPSPTSPSLSPSSTSKSYYFTVLQQLNNISVKSFNEAPNPIVFRKAVAIMLQMPLHSVSIQQNTSTLPAEPNATPKNLPLFLLNTVRTYLNSFGLASTLVPVCYLTVKVLFSVNGEISSSAAQSNVTYQRLSAKLTKGVNVDAFHAILLHYSAEKNTTAFSGVHFAVPVVSVLFDTEAVHVDDSSKKDSGTAMPMVVVWVIVGLVILCGGLWYFVYKRSLHSRRAIATTNTLYKPTMTISDVEEQRVQPTVQSKPMAMQSKQSSSVMSIVCLENE